ncbi:hypothetical protein FCL47_17440 [Desulfopila sp. IMCC35006]|nr:hypothetical protein FCL47_17440 [Desulfopila sp. IMCC35006]
MKTSMNTTSEMTTGNRKEWLSFLLLAFIVLPTVMVGAIAIYGFAVWGLQILVFGPPS